MKKISSYDTVNLGELCAQIDWLAADAMRTPRDVEDFPPEQVGYVDRMNNDIAQYNDGVHHLKCAIMRYLLKDEEDEDG
jgi:hypothetical protein